MGLVTCGLVTCNSDNQALEWPKAEMFGLDRICGPGLHIPSTSSDRNFAFFFVPFVFG